MCGYLPPAPYWGPGPKPRHVLWLGIKLVTLWFSGQHSIHWAMPARATIFFFFFLKKKLAWWGWVEINGFSSFLSLHFREAGREETPWGWHEVCILTPVTWSEGGRGLCVSCLRHFGEAWVWASSAMDRGHESVLWLWQLVISVS